MREMEGQGKRQRCPSGYSEVQRLRPRRDKLRQERRLQGGPGARGSAAAQLTRAREVGLAMRAARRSSMLSV
jgi:hypothetical protein